MGKHQIPAIYLIRNKLNNRVYIGQSKDVVTRLNRYRREAVANTLSGLNAIRPIDVALRYEGLDNFEFVVLESGGKCADKDYRLKQETRMIEKYKSYLPEYGYNIVRDTVPRGETPIFSTAMTKNRLSFAKPVITYDIKTDQTMLYLSGVTALANELGYDRTAISHNIQRGSLVKGRYYVFFLDNDKRHKTTDKIYKTKVDAPIKIRNTKTDPEGAHAEEGRRRAMINFTTYFNIARKIDQIVKDYGY